MVTVAHSPQDYINEQTLKQEVDEGLKATLEPGTNR
jgi:hypothetical protein